MEFPILSISISSQHGALRPEVLDSVIGVRRVKHGTLSIGWKEYTIDITWCRIILNLDSSDNLAITTQGLVAE